MNQERFRRRAAELVAYCLERGYNDRYFLLWDLSLHSGRRRFVVWSVAKDIKNTDLNRGRCQKILFFVFHDVCRAAVKIAGVQNIRMPGCVE